jgi:hypothetical protein
MPGANPTIVNCNANAAAKIYNAKSSLARFLKQKKICFEKTLFVVVNSEVVELAPGVDFTDPFFGRKFRAKPGADPTKHNFHKFLHTFVRTDVCKISCKLVKN